MGYMFDVYITNYTDNPLTWDGDASIISHGGYNNGVPPVTVQNSVPASSAEPQLAFTILGDKNKDVSGKVSYNVPGATMLFHFGTDSDGGASYECFVELQPLGADAGTTGYDTTFVVNRNPSAGWTQNWVFPIYLDVHLNGDKSYNTIPNDAWANTWQVIIENNTSEWLTLNYYTGYNYDCPPTMTGGTTSVSPNTSLMVHEWVDYDGLGKPELTFNLTSDYIFKVKPNGTKPPDIYFVGDNGDYSFGKMTQNGQQFITPLNKSK